MGAHHRDGLDAKKKIQPTVREFNIAQYILRTVEIGIRTEMMDHLTIGMLYDVYVEKLDDGEDWPLKATKEDYDDFFGG